MCPPSVGVERTGLRLAAVGVSDRSTRRERSEEAGHHRSRTKTGSAVAPALDQPADVRGVSRWFAARAGGLIPDKQQRNESLNSS